MRNRRNLAALIVAFASLASAGCRDAPLAQNVESNMSPRADAGDMQTFPYDGTPVDVTLDGSGSSDSDGKISEYHWFNGNTADGGSGRAEPDPDDVANPKLTLGAGVFTFVLFVVDDKGGVSDPSTVTITIGDVVAPEVTECANDALETIADGCRSCVCGVSEVCRTAITGCDQACWDFYGCVQNQCGDVDPSDMDGLANCVRMNCAAFFGGVGGYMPLQPCLEDPKCADTCSESVKES